MTLTVNMTVTQTNVYSVLVVVSHRPLTSAEKWHWEQRMVCERKEFSFIIENWLVNWTRDPVQICASYTSNCNWVHEYQWITLVITSVYHWLFHLLLNTNGLPSLLPLCVTGYSIYCWIPVDYLSYYHFVSLAIPFTIDTVMTFNMRRLCVGWNTFITQNIMVWIQTQFQSHNTMHQRNLPIHHGCKGFNSFLWPLAIRWNQIKQWAVQCHCWSIGKPLWNAVKSMWKQKTHIH